jgi:hypothetical protein
MESPWEASAAAGNGREPNSSDETKFSDRADWTVNPSEMILIQTMDRMPDKNGPNMAQVALQQNRRRKSRYLPQMIEKKLNNHGRMKKWLHSAISWLSCFPRSRRSDYSESCVICLNRVYILSKSWILQDREWPPRAIARFRFVSILIRYFVVPCPPVSNIIYNVFLGYSCTSHG